MFSKNNEVRETRGSLDRAERWDASVKNYNISVCFFTIT